MGYRRPMGKISKQLKNEFKEYKEAKIFNITGMKSSSLVKKLTENLDSDFKKMESTEGIDPMAKIYTMSITFFSGIFELLGGFHHFDAITNQVAKLRDDYMPDYPPVSPISKSYYAQWELFDMQTEKDKETISGIILDIADVLGMNDGDKQILEKIALIKMGIYEVRQKEGTLFLLDELVTGEEFWAVNNSNYKGDVGQLWYVRRLPRFEEYYDYSLISTTPYVLLKQKRRLVSFF